MNPYQIKTKVSDSLKQIIKEDGQNLDLTPHLSENNPNQTEVMSNDARDLMNKAIQLTREYTISSAGYDEKIITNIAREAFREVLPNAGMYAPVTKKLELH